MTDEIARSLAGKLRAERAQEFDEYVAYERKMLETEFDAWTALDRERWIELNDNLFRFIMNETGSDSSLEIIHLKLGIRTYIHSEILSKKG